MFKVNDLNFPKELYFKWLIRTFNLKVINRKMLVSI